MRVCVTYWYHSCFSLEMGDKAMLFDYARRGMHRSTDEKIKTMVKDLNLYVFVSHAHGDHFSPKVTKFLESAKKTHFILSNDVDEKSISKKISEGDTLTSMEPSKVYQIDDLKVKAWKSNDAGLAYLIDYKDKKIYYAGDLAKWNWPEWGDQKVKDHVKVFDDVVEELRKENIDIAFSNMDERLSSWAGPVELMERVEPTYFVPMHTFGNENWVNDLMDTEIDAESQIFNYEKAGDRFCCDI